MSFAQQEMSDDFVKVAVCGTPTEAYILKGVLESAGLSPQVADANIVQANTWMSPALGGVRVLVPLSQLQQAQEVIAAFNAGAYTLGEGSADAVTRPEIPAPVFSPDVAAAWGFLLTPLFGPSVQVANCLILGSRAGLLGQVLWLVFGVLAMAAGLKFVVARFPGDLFVVFRASLMLSLLQIAWYVSVGQSQSRHFIECYGPNYKRRPLWLPISVAVMACLAVGMIISGVT